MPERPRTRLGALFAPTVWLTFANALAASCARPVMIPSPPPPAPPPPHGTTTPAPPAPPTPPAAARAAGRTMGADGVLHVLMGEGESAVVARMSSCLAPRGTDFVRDVELLPARDAVALTPEGTWAVDARGDFFPVWPATAAARCARRPCVPREVAGHGRVVFVSDYGIARLEDGTVARRTRASAGWVVDHPSQRVVDVHANEFNAVFSRRELLANGDVRHVVVRGNGRTPGATDEFTTSLLRVPDPIELVESFHGDAACVRGRGGDLRCGAHFDLHRHFTPDAGRILWAPLDVPPTGAAQVAVSERELCRVGVGGELSCAQFLPQDDYGPRGTPALTFTPVGGLDDVREVGLGHDAGCARRRSGEVMCWGEMFRHGGVVRRGLPVAVGGFDAVERLVNLDGYLCALQRGVVSCWGGGGFRLRSVARPRPLTGASDATGLATAGAMLCVTRAPGGVGCWSGDPFDSSLWMARGLPGGALHSLVGARGKLYVLDDRAQAWVLDTQDRMTFAFRRAASLDGYDHLIAADQIVCALRGTELLCPTDRDPSRVNEGRGPWYAESRARLLLLAPRLAAGQGAETLIGRYPRELAPDEWREWEEVAVRALLPGGVRASGAEGTTFCLLGVNGRVACRWTGRGWHGMGENYCAGVDHGLGPALVPGLDDAVELRGVGGLSCARRATGAVVCWGSNELGVLTVEDDEHSPALYSLDAMVARARARRVP